MRNRLRIHFKALTFSFSAVGALLFLVFFFYDGPLPLPVVEPEAMATEASLAVSQALPAEASQTQPKSFFGIFSSNLHPQWHQVSLDKAQVRLNVLKTPLLLSL